MRWPKPDYTLEAMIGARVRDAWRVEYSDADWERLQRIEAALARMNGMAGLRSALRIRLLTECGHSSEWMQRSIMTSLDESSTEYCPECGWNAYATLWPGNNGLVVRHQCSFCGWIGLPEVGA